jgi:solute carrier family 25 (adenine nucleotide translocator) protein 4/5/6/31
MQDAVELAVSGVLGGLVANTIMHPVELAQKRIMVNSKHLYNGLIDTLRKTARQNGIGGLYEGMGMSWVSNITKNAVFFFSYESLKAMQPDAVSDMRALE